MTDSTAERAYVSWYGGERRQTWQTPPQFFAELDHEFSFTMDGAALPDTALASVASTPEDPLPWEGQRVFCNPPWSNIRPFIELAAAADVAVLLVPARTNSRWFHRALEIGAEVRFFKPKLKFVGAPPPNQLFLSLSTAPVTDPGAASANQTGGLLSSASSFVQPFSHWSSPHPHRPHQ